MNDNNPSTQQAGPVQKPTRPSPLTLTPVSMASKTDMSTVIDISLADPFAPSPTTPSPMARPPTPGGGPLSSHPATPVNLTDRYAPPPPFPSVELQSSPQEVKPVDSVTDGSPIRLVDTQTTNDTPTRPSPPRLVSLEEAAAAYAAAGNAPSLSSSRPTSSHLNSFSSPTKTTVTPRKPLTPASGNVQKPLQRSNSTGVKKLLSLSSLRSSFSSNRGSTSSLQRTATGSELLGSNRRPSTTLSISPPMDYRRGSTPCLTQYSSAHADIYGTYSASVVSGGASPVDNASNVSAAIPRPRKRKSGSWFRRASMLMNLDGESKQTDSFYGGDDASYVVSGAKRSGEHLSPRRSPRAPVLPELKGLALQNTERWGEGIFSGIEPA